MNSVLKVITGNKTVRKASTALGTTLIGGLGIALSDGSLEWQEVLVALGASLVATAGVWKASNGDVPVVEVEVK